MFEYSCSECDKKYNDTEVRYYCHLCNSVLEINYPTEIFSSFKYNFSNNTLKTWINLLPLDKKKKVISLGEGNTPLIKNNIFDFKNIYIKQESYNPTGSFKDRAICTAVNYLNQKGYKRFITSSSGNAGISLCTYSAATKSDCIVVVPENTPESNLNIMSRFCSKIIKIKGNLSDSLNIVKNISKEYGFINITTTYQSPISTEGDKTVGYELAKQLNWKTPDWIIVPVGDGPLLYAIYKAFEDLQKIGLIKTLPKMVAAQAEGCSPIHRAWISNKKVKAWKNIKTKAKGIADPLKGYEQDGDFTIKIVKESKGTVLSISEDIIKKTQNIVHKYYGISTEFSSAVGFASINDNHFKWLIRKDDIIVIINTGSSFKEESNSSLYHKTENNLEDVKNILEGKT